MSSRREEERNEKIIRGLLKLPPNRRCINCNSMGPQYVCTNFWTFVCMICSGIHREFTHRVKSVSMSKFTLQEVEALQNGGNQRAREIYLKDWDLDRQRQPNSSNVDKVREFIKAVYIDRKYAGGNNSEKPPRDMQIQRNVGDETRRASSYHSFSQSPPYDFQYEDRLNRKQVGSLTRKPGSDHNLFERKAASFLYSPGRLSEHLYEDRFANEGSSSRVSDYSLSSGGDPFKSAPQSPNLQTDDGFSSPTSDSSREIVDGLNRTYSETFAKRDIPLPRPQRTMSSVSDGSFEKNSASLPSIDSGSSFDAFPEPNHSNATTQNKVSTILSPSQLPVESVGGLNFFENASGMPAPNSALSFDLFQASRVESVASVDLFQFPADSSALSKKFPQTSCSSSSSFLPQTSQNPTVPNLHQKLPESSEPSNEGWATFDAPQHGDIPGTNTVDTVGSEAGSEGGITLSNLNYDSSIDGLQQIAPTEGFSFPILPSFVEPMHPFMSDEASARQNSVNPFDVPFDSELEAHNSFLDMSTLQAALPNKSLPPSYMSSINEPWFPGNSVASPGGISYMTVQAPSSQLQNVPTHGPVASVGGNPFA
ncbi:hypothetical protein BVRB_8g201970 [Beta vulgaris subsp. vulgaris]|uniref:Arf-GAP domain-containing protein n=1 Tax=Beta vulgaris subsp. vulgaris TaxID=3555 RepID=A0A0J8B5Q7_BETVV|nr:hypothetical protein BVRB_8g201970 [Beta vulgaris subsp. vulgaris]